MRDFLDLDKRDREILSLLEKSPEMSQNDMAEILKISQPSVSARIYKLKQKGALAHVVGMNLKKVKIHMAKVDVTANNTSSLLDVFIGSANRKSNCAGSGDHMPDLVRRVPGGIQDIPCFAGIFMLDHEDIATLEAIVDGHLRNNPLVKSAEVSIVITPLKDLIMPLRMNFDFKDTPPCGNQCKCEDCHHHISNRCLGCPVTNNYSGNIWK